MRTIPTSTSTPRTCSSTRRRVRPVSASSSRRRWSVQVGFSQLASRDPQIAPRIDLNLLAEPEDRARLVEGTRLSREIGRTAPLAEFFDSELNPGPAALSDAEIEAAIVATIDIYHHPTSTAPMGGTKDPHAVVDELGSVRHIDGLRVVDASIFPDPPSVATGLTVIMAAEHIARLAYAARRAQVRPQPTVGLARDLARQV